MCERESGRVTDNIKQERSTTLREVRWQYILPSNSVLGTIFDNVMLAVTWNWQFWQSGRAPYYAFRILTMLSKCLVWFLRLLSKSTKWSQVIHNLIWRKAYTATHSVVLFWISLNTREYRYNGDQQCLSNTCCNGFDAHEKSPSNIYFARDGYMLCLLLLYNFLGSLSHNIISTFNSFS